MNNFGFYGFLLFSALTKLLTVCNLFWVSPRIAYPPPPPSSHNLYVFLTLQKSFAENGGEGGKGGRGLRSGQASFL
jgi:hypothetical protein